jgi:hypothetical protein
MPLEAPRKAAEAFLGLSWYKTTGERLKGFYGLPRGFWGIQPGGRGPEDDMDGFRCSPTAPIPGTTTSSGQGGAERPTTGCANYGLPPHPLRIDWGLLGLE